MCGSTWRRNFLFFVWCWAHISILFPCQRCWWLTSLNLGIMVVLHCGFFPVSCPGRSWSWLFFRRLFQVPYMFLLTSAFFSILLSGVLAYFCLMQHQVSCSPVTYNLINAAQTKIQSPTSLTSFFFVTELNDREEQDIHFPIIYGIGELIKLE